MINGSARVTVAAVADLPKEACSGLTLAMVSVEGATITGAGACCPSLGNQVPLEWGLCHAFMGLSSTPVEYTVQQNTSASIKNEAMVSKKMRLCLQLGGRMHEKKQWETIATSHTSIVPGMNVLM